MTPTTSPLTAIQRAQIQNSKLMATYTERIKGANKYVAANLVSTALNF